MMLSETKKTKQNKTVAQEKDYFKTATEWEYDRYNEMRKSKKIAWRIAGFSLTVALASVLAVAALTPLKTVVPYVIRVDNITGITDIVTAIDEETMTTSEAVDKFFIARYVRARESYSMYTRDEDYSLVGLMSSSSVSTNYAEWYDPRINPDSPLKIYGDFATVKIDIKNISFVDENVALVRFYKTVRRGSDKSITHWVSTVSFKYINGTMSFEDRMKNPLGFQCIEYRIDPESIYEKGKE